MGGIFLVPSILVSTLLFAKLNNIFVVSALCLVGFYARIGLLDDWQKLRGGKGAG